MQQRPQFNRHAFLFMLLSLFPGIGLAQRPAGNGNRTAGYDVNAVAGRIVELSAIDRGVCSVLGAENGPVALVLAGTGKFFVSVLDPSNSLVEGLRKAADAKDLYGRFMLAEKGVFSPLPYADNSVDLILTLNLTGDDLKNLSTAELLRVLRPRGKALVGRLKTRETRESLTREQLDRWLNSAGIAQKGCTEDELGLWAVLTKPSLEGVDDWSHWEHGPDNNPVSTDAVIKAPYMTQFLGLPYYIAMPAITTAADGRIFTAMGHIAHHEREESWLNTLIAQNGFNGTELWRMNLPDGYLVHRSAFIATAGAFYMINPEGSGCLLLDPETGAEKDRILLRELPGQWKW
ncbi:MAG: methyltransferase domain-containing protein, partial [Candidatus Glassbacteria bacterium]